MAITEYKRIVHDFTNVGVNWKEFEVTKVPKEFRIKRARAEITDGSGTVEFAVRETSDPSSEIDVALQYSATTSPLDSREDIYFSSQSIDSLNSSLGSVYLAVKCISGTNAVSVSLDIEIIG